MSGSGGTSAAEFDQIAKSARVQAGVLQKVFKDLANKSRRVIETVGGTATGKDKQMIQLLDEATSRTGRAITELESAAVEATKAAAAIRAEEAEARQQAKAKR